MCVCARVAYTHVWAKMRFVPDKANEVGHKQATEHNTIGYRTQTEEQRKTDFNNNKKTRSTDGDL